MLPEIAWTPWAIPGLLVLPVAGGMAVFVLLARPDRAQNRRLALQLALEAFVVSVLGGAVWILDDPVSVYALGATAFFFVWPKLWAYYSFLATLPTPLAKGLRLPGALPALLVVTLAAGGSVFVRPDLYQLAPVSGAPIAAWLTPPGSAFVLIMNLWALMWLVGLSFSISAYRRAPTRIERDRAKAYLIAFGFRDIAFLLTTLGITLVPATSPFFIWVFLTFPLIWVIYPLIVAYGILHAQLFDIELKIKKTFRGSLVGAVFIVVFFAVSEAAVQFFGSRTGSADVGIGAAALLMFALSPLQRIAGRVMDAAMPGVEPTQEYISFRKLEVYRAALEEALSDGRVSAKDRRLLERLRTDLAINDASARALEADVAQDADVPIGVVRQPASQT